MDTTQNYERKWQVLLGPNDLVSSPGLIPSPLGQCPPLSDTPVIPSVSWIPPLPLSDTVSVRAGSDPPCTRGTMMMRVMCQSVNLTFYGHLSSTPQHVVLYLTSKCNSLLLPVSTCVDFPMALLQTHLRAGRFHRPSQTHRFQICRFKRFHLRSSGQNSQAQALTAAPTSCEPSGGQVA